MNRPSDILSDIAMQLIRDEHDFNREKNGELNRGKLDKQLDEAMKKAMDGIVAIAGASEQERETLADKEIQSLVDTVREVYTKVGAEAGTKLAQQKYEQEQERKRLAEPEPLKREELSNGEPSPQQEEEPIDTCADFSAADTRNFIQEMESRVNLQVLGAKIRDDYDLLRICKKPLQVRINEADKKLEKAIKEVGGEAAQTNMENAICEYDDAITGVYFSLGMKVGAKLNNLLLGDFVKDY